MLIDEHADANAGHVETIKEVMDSMFNRLIDLMRFTQFDDTFGHRWDDIGVSISNYDQRFAESKISYFYKINKTQ